MPSSAAYTALFERALANWQHTPIRGLNPEDGQVPADGSAFLEIQFPIGTEQQMSIGAPGENIWRETGAVRFVLALPVGTGLGLWLFRIDNFRAVFRGQDFNGVRTYDVSPAIVRPEADDWSYTIVSFAVAYEYDATG
jgi:hypothetical protein